MLFPWVGMLEQMRLADVFVHYDDVQFSKGSFSNRVQVKTREGARWMTIPLQNFWLGQSIDEVAAQDLSIWRARHMALLTQSFQGAPYAGEALDILESVYSGSYQSVGGYARASMMALANYYGLLDGKVIVDVRELAVGGNSSARVLDVVSALGGNTYITGHGARNYLDHESFERAGVEVQYMRYECRPYPQLWGDFTPYVTGLDLVANCGSAGIDWICSHGIPWRDFGASQESDA